MTTTCGWCGEAAENSRCSECGKQGYLHDDDGSKELIKLRELVANIYMNARIGPDPFRGGATDAYIVPLDDIEAVRDFIKARATPTPEA